MLPDVIKRSLDGYFAEMCGERPCILFSVDRLRDGKYEFGAKHPEADVAQYLHIVAREHDTPEAVGALAAATFKEYFADLSPAFRQKVIDWHRGDQRKEFPVSEAIGEYLDAKA